MDSDTLQVISNAVAMLGSIAGVIGVVIAYRTLKEAGRQRKAQRLDDIANFVSELKGFAQNGGNTFFMRNAQRRLRLRAAGTGLVAVRQLAEATLRSGDAQSLAIAEAAEAEVEAALLAAE